MKINIITGCVRINSKDYASGDSIRMSLVLPITIFFKQDSKIELNLTENRMILIETLSYSDGLSEKKMLIDSEIQKNLTIESNQNDVVIISKLSGDNNTNKEIRFEERLKIIENNYVTKETLNSALRDFVMGPLKNEINESIEEAFSKIGLKNGEASKDIRELRDLITNWRKIKQEASKTVVSFLTRLLLLALLTGIAIKTKAFDLLK